MHAIISVITRDYKRFPHLLDYYQEQDYFDWYVLGGRYNNLIPVGINSKPILANGDDNIEIDNTTKMVNVARIRNIKRNHTAFSDLIYSPYYFIFDERLNDDICQSIIANEGEEMHGRIRDMLINDDSINHFFIGIFDIHF